MKTVKNRITAIVVLFSVFLFGCSEDKSGIVAEFGNDKITLDEYKIGYLNILKNPDVFDSRELREQFLDEMIRTRLIADEAYKMKLDTSEKYRYRFEAYENKALREAHFDHVIKPEIKISQDDVEKAYMFTQEQRKINHLFFKTKQEADSVYKLLQSGSKFEELAKQVFSDTELKESGGDLGWVYWDQMDYDLAQAAFTTPVGEYSKPVHSTYGYHIVRVTDFKKNPLISRSEYEQRKRKVRYMLEYKIGDKLAYEYIHESARKADVDIKEDAFWFVHDKLAGKFKRRPTRFDRMHDLQLKEDEVKLMESSLRDVRNRVIVTVNGRDYTIAQMMAALNYIPYEQLYQNFKGALDLVIRDIILTEEAKQMGLDKEPEVQTKLKLFKDYTLQLDLRRKVVRKVSVTNNEVEENYNENKEKYKNAAYKDVYPIVKKILLSKKRRNAIPQYSDSLAKELTIKKYPEVIHEYYDSLEKGF